jgi:hypothetical protein
LTQREFVRRERIRIFNIKIDLEKTVRRDLKTYFAQQRKNIRTGKKTKTIAPVLQKHYERVARRLVRRNIKQSDPIDDSIRDFNRGRAERRAIVIDETTEKDDRMAMERARQALADEGVRSPTERQLRIAAGSIFMRLSNGRLSSIANSETQSTVEGQRRVITTEAQAELRDVIMDEDRERAQELWEDSRDYTSYTIKERLGTTDAVVLLTLLAMSQKMWQTMGDSLVRMHPYNHQEANGQKVGVNDPFIVSGQLLMYPGDSSLGASIGNTINCRCVVIYM